MHQAAAFVGVCVLVVAYTLKRQHIRKRDWKRRISLKKISPTSDMGRSFGLDIGGTLSKIVYFEQSSSSQRPRANSHVLAAQEVSEFVKASDSYGSSGVRDTRLSIASETLGGTLHFIHFETRKMEGAVLQVANHSLNQSLRVVSCTGGGAHKYADMIHQLAGIQVQKKDEIECLVKGLNFLLNVFPQEVFTFVNVDFTSLSATRVSLVRDNKEEDIFPYILVSIGSGVSVLHVTGPNSYTRVSGSSIGGGTYWGLCRMLFECQTYDEALDLCVHGRNASVDMSVGDIYGGAYEKFNLPATTVASSFGKMITVDRSQVSDADIARSLLVMTTQNIGLIAYLNACIHGTKRIFFVGNFLRHNKISCRTLAYAINFWSKGEMKAHFCRHEGYFRDLKKRRTMSSGVPSYLRSTSSSSGKVKKDAEKKPADYVVRRPSAKKEKDEFRVRPPAAPLAIAIPSSAPVVASTGATALQRQKRPVVAASPKKVVKRTTGATGEERKIRSQPIATSNVPSYMRQTVSRGYKEGTLQHPGEPASISPPQKKATTPRQVLKSQGTSKATAVSAVSRKVVRQPSQAKVPVKEPCVEVNPDNDPESPPASVEKIDIVAHSEHEVKSIMTVDEALDLALALRQLEEYKSQLESAEATITQTTNERDEAQAHCKELRTNMDKMTQSIALHKQRIESYNDTTLTLQRQRDSLQEELIEHKMALSDLKCQMQTVVSSTPSPDSSERVAELTASVSTLQEELATKDKEMAKLNHICGKLQLEVNHFEKKELEWQTTKSTMDRLLTDLQANILTLENRAEVSVELQEQMNKLHVERKEIIAKYEEQLASADAQAKEALKATFEEQDQLRKSLELAHAQQLNLLTQEHLAKIQKLEAHIDEHAQRVDAVKALNESNVVDLKSRVAELESQVVIHTTVDDSTIQDYKNRLDAAEATIMGLQAQIDRTNAVNQRLRQQLEHARLHFEDHNVNSSDIDERNSAVQNAELLTQKCLGYEMEISRLHGTIEAYEEQQEEMEAELAHYKDELSSSQSHIQSLENTIANVQSEFDNLKEEKELLESNHQALVVAAENALLDHQEQVSHLQKQLQEKSALSLECDANAAIIEALKSEVQDLEEKKVQQAKENEQLKIDNDKLTLSLQNMVEAKDNEMKQICNQKATLEQECVELQEQVFSLKESLQTQYQAIETDKQAIQAIEESYKLQVSELTEQLATENLQKNTFAESLTKANEDLSVLRAEIQEKEAALTIAIAKLTDEANERVQMGNSHKEIVNALTKEKMELQLAIKLKQDELLKTQEDIAAHDAIVESYKEQLTSVSAATTDQDQERSRLQEQLTSLQDEYKQQSDRMEAVVAELEVVKTQHEKYKSSQMALLTALQSEVTKYTTENEDLQKKWEHINMENTALKAGMEAYKLELNAMHDSHKRDQQNDTKASDHEQLKSKRSTATKEKVLTDALDNANPLDSGLPTTASEVERLQQQLNQQKEEEKRLREQIQELQAKVATTSSAIERPPAHSVMGRGIIVLHTGSFDLQAGLLYEDINVYIPLIKISGLVAVPKNGISELQRVLKGSSYIGTGSIRLGYERGYFIGKDALHFLYEHPDPALRCVLKQERVFRNGQVTSFEYLEAMLSQVFQSIGVENHTSDYNVIVTHKPLVSSTQRERMLEVLFEKCDVKGAFLTTDALMSLRSKGKNTGLVLDICADTIYVVPIYEDMILEHAVVNVPMGGEDLVAFMHSMLLSQKCDEYHKIPLRLQKQIARTIFETKGMVAKDFESMAAKHGRFKRTNVKVLPTQSQPLWEKDVPYDSNAAHPLNATYSCVLPSGSVLEMHCDVERFICPELLWQPELNADNSCTLSLQRALASSIEACDEGLRSELLTNVVCTGGVSLLPGFEARLQLELEKIAPTEPLIVVDVLTKDEYAPFSGTCMYASGLKPHLWITAQEFDDKGAGIVHAKCF